MEINGKRIEFKRRRYGSCTFTWAHIVEGTGRDETWHVLGDPWQAVRFPISELKRRIEIYERTHS